MEDQNIEIVKLNKLIDGLINNEKNQAAHVEATKDVFNMSDNQYDKYLKFLEKQHTDNIELKRLKNKSLYKLLNSLKIPAIMILLLIGNIFILFYFSISVAEVVFEVLCIGILMYAMSYLL